MYNEKSIAIVICNYNKKDYVKRNIYSLKMQSIKNFNIYLVDNASVDNTVEEISNEFGDEVHIIQNRVNLGGSGGFNTGIREVMKEEYPYIILLDNDVELKEDCVENLYTDMEKHPDIGIMGAKILRMDHRDVIQEFAPTLNYETLTFELNYGGEKDEGTLPHLADCDYVPACALIVRRKVAEKIGYMPEENFIYYDDITWGVRCWRAGYRVVANSHASVWHKGGASVNFTTFVTYYLNRNKFKFFMSYMSTDGKEEVTERQIEERAERVLLDMFEGIYSCRSDGRNGMVKSRMDAFLDALCGVTGKAGEDKIRQREIPEEKINKLLKGASSLLIYMNGEWENTRRILYYISMEEQEEGKDYQIELVDEVLYRRGKILGREIYKNPRRKDTEFDLIFHVCKHAYELKIDDIDRTWIDGWRNIISDRDDFENYKLFMPMYQTFKLCFEDRVKGYIKKAMGEKQGV